MRHIFIVFVTLFFVNIWTIEAQRNFRDYNKIGLSAGYLLANIETDNLPLSASDGFMFGFETRGSFSRIFDFIYALSYYDASMELETNASRPTAMQLSSVQLQFLGSINIIRHHLSVELGPAVAIQGKFKPKNDADDSRIITGYDFLTVGDLRNVSTVDFRAVTGITTGIEPFRLSLMYIYGLTNSFANLKESGTPTADFTGNTSYIAARAIFYF